MTESLKAKYLQGRPKLNTDQKFRLVLYILRSDLPPDRPVRVRRVSSKDPVLKKLNANGYTHLVNSSKRKAEQYFLIVINRDMDWHKQLDAIMHEWAHAMTWDIPSSQDHNRAWAHSYGKIFRRLIED